MIESANMQEVTGTRVRGRGVELTRFGGHYSV